MKRTLVITVNIAEKTGYLDYIKSRYFDTYFRAEMERLRYLEFPQMLISDLWAAWGEIKSDSRKYRAAHEVRVQHYKAIWPIFRIFRTHPDRTL